MKKFSFLCNISFFHSSFIIETRKINMDYKYIEQLLDRYFAAETSLEEEHILRAFFSQKDVPAALEQYRALFACQVSERENEVLDDDFDARILEMIDGNANVQEPAPVVVKARTLHLSQRLMPLFKAAAVVAIFLTLGQAAQTPWDASWNSTRVNYASSNQALTSDSITVTPVQAEYIDMPVDSTTAIPDVLPKD